MRYDDTERIDRRRLQTQLEDQLAPEAPLAPENTTMPVGTPMPQGGGFSGGMDLPQLGLSSNLADNAKKSAAAGYTDIEGAGDLKTGNYGVEGFNTAGWGTNERGTNTMKNSFGKIASRYDPTQQGAAQALMADPDFKSLWPEATIVEHPNQDLIDFDGPGGQPPVDVLRAATAGGAGQGWQWGVRDGGGGAAMPTDAAGLMGGDPLALINENINGLIGGEQDSMTQRLIQQILRGEAL